MSFNDPISINPKGDAAGPNVPKALASTIADTLSGDTTNQDNHASIQSPATHKEKYHLKGEIARGGMGIILKAEDNTLHRDVAMKVMLNSGSASDNRKNRFIEEARITSRLQHPGIMPIHELGSNRKGNVYYTMKCVQGRTLRDILEKLQDGDRDIASAYPLSVLMSIFQKVCDAVAYAHSEGVIHRDIKPENIMIGAFGEVLVLDWGLAKLLNKQTERQETGDRSGESGLRSQDSAAGPNQGGQISELGDSPELDIHDSSFGIAGFETATAGTPGTMDGSAIGTPAYMSPEQARGEINATNEQSDIYSLGAILYHILALKPTVPFGLGNDRNEILKQIGAGQVQPLKASEHIPEALAAVAMKALALRPEDRYLSVKDMQADIEAYHSGFLTTAEEWNLWKYILLFIYRHRTGTKIAALTLVLMTIGLTISISQKTRAEKAELHALRLEKERTEQWIPVVEQDFSRDKQLDAGFEVDGDATITNNALEFGFKSALRSLNWTKDAGDEIKIEVCFSCDTAPLLDISLQQESGRDLEFFSSMQSINLAALEPEWTHLCSQFRADEEIRTDKPNTLVVGRKKNRFFASINGTDMLDYYYARTFYVGEGSGFEIRRMPTAYSAMRIHSIRVWTRQDPQFIGIIEPGRRMLIDGDLSSARAWFLRQSRSNPDMNTRQEAEYLVTQTFTVGEHAEKQILLEAIVANTSHQFRYHAMHELALISSASGDWNRTIDLTCQATLNAPQLNTLKYVFPNLSRHLAELPEAEKQASLRQICRLPLRHIVLQQLGLTSIEFIKDSPIDSINLSDNAFDDLTPLKGLKAKELIIGNTQASDITPLAGLELRTLKLQGTPVRDLSPLKGHSFEILSLDSCTNLNQRTLSGIKAKVLSLNNTSIIEPSILTGTGAVELRVNDCNLHNIRFANLLQLTALSAANNRIADLTPLKGALLSRLNLRNNKISDLSPLSTCIIRQCDLGNNPISDLGPLKGREFKSLNLSRTLVDDISALRDMPLNELNISYTAVKDLSILPTLSRLKTLNVEGLTINGESFDILSSLRIKTLNIGLTPSNLEIACRNRQLKQIGSIDAEYARKVADDLLPLLGKTTVTGSDIADLQQHGTKTMDSCALVIPLLLTFQEAELMSRKLGATLPCPSTPDKAKSLTRLMRTVVRSDKDWSASTWTGQEVPGHGDLENAVEEQHSSNKPEDTAKAGSAGIFTATGANQFTLGTADSDAKLITVIEWQSDARAL